MNGNIKDSYPIGKLKDKKHNREVRVPVRSLNVVLNILKPRNRIYSSTQLSVGSSTGSKFIYGALRFSRFGSCNLIGFINKTGKH